MLVNNAGVGFHRPFADEPAGGVAAEIRLNCGALVDLTARFLPGMRKARRGVVINLASTSAFQPVPTMAVYAATKAFVLSLTEALWWESRGSGVRVPRVVDLTAAPGKRRCLGTGRLVRIGGLLDRAGRCGLLG